MEAPGGESAAVRLTTKGNKMTKHEEIETLRKFVSAIPQNSYLADFMAESVDHFERQITSDISECGGWVKRQLTVECDLRQARTELHSVKCQVEAERNTLKATEKVVNRHRDELEEIRRAAVRLAGCK
jgi:hypothetical protein